MNNKALTDKIENRVKVLVKEKERCLDWYLKNCAKMDKELEAINASLNMAYGIEIKFLNELKESLND